MLLLPQIISGFDRRMLASNSVISCNFSSPSLKNPIFRTSAQTPNLKPPLFSNPSNSIHSLSLKYFTRGSKFLPLSRKGLLQKCQNSLNNQKTLDPNLEEEGDGGDGGEERDWTTSILLFFFWAGVLYYVFNLAPNQTPSLDLYFLKKLLNLTGDDGFQLNEVLVSLWYIMGLWPLLYSMLLLPTARSSKGSIPVWPFLILSCFGGAYALLPYFILWRPPPPTTEETELKRWPLNFLESKLTAGVTLAAGLGIIVYAGIANGEVWKEFYQYFRGSKFIHVTCIDFSLLSAFAPFWVYNDMTVRKWYHKGFWLLPFSLVPFLGPAVYVLLRPSISEVPSALSSATSVDE